MAVAAAPAPEAAPATVAPLVLSYRGPSWTEVRDRNGQVLLSRLVAPGSEQPIRGNGPFDIVIGNARAVTLVHRGKPIDLSRYTRQNVARLRLP
jgi:cytoskeleton protein RodZ